MLTTDRNAVENYQNAQIEELLSEEKENGGYDNWYNGLKPFREYIRKKYIKFDLLGKIFKCKFVRLPSGDLIDHHVLSYLSPMTFTRIGWNEKRLYPHEHLKQISDFFRMHGTRFIYVALPNKGSVSPSIICDDCPPKKIHRNGENISRKLSKQA